MLPLLPFPVLIYENKIPENEFLQYLKLSSYEVKFSLTLHNSTGWPRSMHRYTYCAPLYNFTTARRVCSSSTSNLSLLHSLSALFFSFTLNLQRVF